MQGSNRSLDHEPAGATSAQRLEHHDPSSFYRRVIPARPVLVLEQDEVALLVHPRHPPGIGNQDQCQQPANLAFVRHQVDQDRAQLDRPIHEIGSYQDVSSGRRVTRSEDEMHRSQHGVETLGQLMGDRHAVGDPRTRDLLLRPSDPSRHGRLANQERMGDLLGGQAADQPQRQRDLRLPRQCRVTAGEDEAKAVVGYVIHLGELRFRRERSDMFTPRAQRTAGLYQQGNPGPKGSGAAVGVQRLAPGRGGQPRARVAWDAVAPPCLEGADIRILRTLLGQVDVAGHAHRRREHAGPLVTVRGGEREPDLVVRGHPEVSPPGTPSRVGPRPRRTGRGPSWPS